MVENLGEPLPAPRQEPLAGHVFACRTNDYVVLLEARTECYLGVEDAIARALGRLAGWPSVPDTLSSPAAPDEVQALLAQMRAQGTLTSAGTLPAERAQPLPRPTAQLIDI